MVILKNFEPEIGMTVLVKHMENLVFNQKEDGSFRVNQVESSVLCADELGEIVDIFPGTEWPYEIHIVEEYNGNSVFQFLRKEFDIVDLGENE